MLLARARRCVAEAVWHVLHGVYMAPRRIWGERPRCPHCDAETDTAHVLRCQHYIEAVAWLWGVAE